MADTALSAMTAASALDGTEIVYGNQSSGDVKITTLQQRTYTLLGTAAKATILATTRAIYGNNFDGSGALTQIISSVYGGTGNGFTKFSGPTTSEKTFTLPDASASLGYLGVPSNSKSAAYTTVLSDAGQSILHAAADDNARTFTIDSNANVAYPVGTVLTFINLKNTLTIAITSDTMTLANSATTGSRTLAVNSIATAVKVGSTSWLISGTGLT